VTHKLVECPYIKPIWDSIVSLTNKILPITPNCDLLERVLGAFRSCTKEVLTINAETLTRFLYLKADDRLPPPKTFIDMVLKSLLKKEIKAEFKTNIEHLLAENRTQ
jgi:hypothetical protein